MTDLLSVISKNLARHKSIVLVGPTDSGKTYWVKNTLIPHLESAGRKVEYLSDGSSLPEGSPEIVICDEVETLFDQDYLRGDNPEDYYTKEYLDKVKAWYGHYAQLPSATLFVITRNEPGQIENLIQNFHQADWDGREVTVLKFEKRNLSEESHGQD